MFALRLSYREVSSARELTSDETLVFMPPKMVAEWKERLAAQEQRVVEAKGEAEYRLALSILVDLQNSFARELAFERFRLPDLPPLE